MKFGPYVRSNIEIGIEVKAYRITKATGPWTKEAFQKELEGLTRHVQLCFEEATKRFAPPSEDHCRYFANHLLTYFLPGEKIPLGSTRKAIKYGKTFLKHLAEPRELNKFTLRLPRELVPDEVRKDAESMLFHIEETERHLEYLFNRLSPKRPSKNEPIRFLAGLAQDLWKNANGGRAPSSRNPNGPIFRLLLSVLEAIHRNPRPATISEVLRGRR